MAEAVTALARHRALLAELPHCPAARASPVWHERSSFTGSSLPSFRSATGADSPCPVSRNPTSPAGTSNSVKTVAVRWHYTVNTSPESLRGARGRAPSHSLAGDGPRHLIDETVSSPIRASEFPISGLASDPNLVAPMVAHRLVRAVETDREMPVSITTGILRVLLSRILADDAHPGPIMPAGTVDKTLCRWNLLPSAINNGEGDKISGTMK